MGVEARAEPDRVSGRKGLDAHAARRMLWAAGKISELAAPRIWWVGVGVFRAGFPAWARPWGLAVIPSPRRWRREALRQDRSVGVNQ